MSRLPPSVIQNRKFEDICSSLEENFGGVWKTIEVIMKAHEAANKIPDPHTSPSATCWKVLWEHCEILRNMERFLSLSTDKNPASENITGRNLMTLLDLLPQRVRMTDPNMLVAETDEEKKYTQYEAFKQWITHNQETLVLQDNKIEDEVKEQRSK